MPFRVWNLVPDPDGFIMTAVLTSDVRNLRKRGAVWPKR